MKKFNNPPPNKSNIKLYIINPVTTEALLLENISMVAMLLSMTFLNANFKDIKKRLPLLRSNNKASVVTGLIIYNLILLLLGGGLLNFFMG